jgi:8-oxo-dGTP diphosphatase
VRKKNDFDKQSKEYVSFEKPMAAASVAVFAKGDNRVLLIIRLTEPFKDRYAFPGGFLDVDNEDLYDTAVREFAEETGFSINKEDLVLIDVRSNPKRDPRGHVIDVGFLSIVENSSTISSVTAEAKSLWMSLDALDMLEFAFDHDAFAANVKSYIQKKLKPTGIGLVNE